MWLHSPGFPAAGRRWREGASPAAHCAEMLVPVRRKEQKREGAAMYKTPGEKVPVESISEFAFSDLAIMIYTKVVLEG